METREWFEQFQAQWREQKLKQAEEHGQAQAVIRLFGKRLGRPLTEAERATLGERLERLGEDRVDQVMLSFSADELAAWLADSEAR